MTARIIPVDTFDLVVFGATGDLARRKLLPALFRRCLSKQLPSDARIVGVARRPLDDDAFRALAHTALADAIGAFSPGADDVARFLGRLHYVAADPAADDGWRRLAELLQASGDRTRVFYLATAPELFGPLCARLAKEGLASAQSRVVVEKPIGKDLRSACEVNDAIGAVFPENAIYRIDHYLGKETVQNLMALRFANALFEPLWNSTHIDHVEITVAETLGVEGRGDYYDRSGALRDMMQNHILQLLCLTAMEPPSSLGAGGVRDEKLKVLQALQPFDASRAAALTVRGQYRAGSSSGVAVPGYLDEVGDPATRTETFVALRAEIANWRWAGVPFYLRTGKRLAQRVSEIVIAFRGIPHSVFEQRSGPIHANHLVIRLQPDEGVKLWIMIKDPGPGGMRLRQMPLDMSFASAFGFHNPDAYERLLIDVLRGDQTLFMRRDEVEAAWRWADPILSAWADSGDGPKAYSAGSWGPSAAVALIERDGRTWHQDADWDNQG